VFIRGAIAFGADYFDRHGCRTGDNADMAQCSLCWGVEDNDVGFENSGRIGKGCFGLNRSHTDLSAPSHCVLDSIARKTTKAD
jgi:hypothetical protein